MNAERKSESPSQTRSGRSGRWIVVVAAIAVATATVAWLSIPTTDAQGVDITVHKTPSCDCCNRWIAHLRENGFKLSVVSVPSTRPIRDRVGVPQRLGSCHTAVIGDYWVEGHVPADLIQRLLTEQPDNIRGISVPGMPIGTPGMEGPNPVAYDVLAYGSNGQTTVYATRRGRRSPH